MLTVTEAEILQALVPELEQEGYSLYVHPHRTLIPQFLGGHVPDAIALRDDKNLVIEIALRKTVERTEQIRRLSELFEGQDKWELRVYWGGPTELRATLAAQRTETIRARIDEVKELRAKNFVGPALLLAWATFEALSRLLMSKEFARPQTPGRLVELLAREGYVTPTEADRLRELANKRNKLVHGELETSISDEELELFNSILDTLLNQVEADVV